MVLSDQDIWIEIAKGSLSFNPPIGTEQVGPCSIDLRLSDKITVFSKQDVPGVAFNINLAQVNNVEEIAINYGYEEVLQGSETFTLKRGMFVLAYTLESVKLPNYLAGRVEGRSSFARLGLSIHQTAPTVHATWEGPLRLEILNNGPYDCELSTGLNICQLILERLSSPAIGTLNSFYLQQSQ